MQRQFCAEVVVLLFCSALICCITAHDHLCGAADLADLACGVAAESLAALAREYMEKGVGVVAISPNSIQTHPQDGPEEMAKDAKLHSKLGCCMCSCICDKGPRGSQVGLHVQLHCRLIDGSVEVVRSSV